MKPSRDWTDQQKEYWTDQQKEFLEYLQKNFFLYPRIGVLGYALGVLLAAGIISFGSAKSAVETGVAKRITDEIVALGGQATNYTEEIVTIRGQAADHTAEIAKLGELATNHLKNLNAEACLLTGPDLRGDGFVRLGDLQICWGDLELKQTTDNKLAKKGVGRFPKEFSEVPKVVVDLHAKPVRSSATTWGCFDYAIGKDGFQYQVMATLNSLLQLPTHNDDVASDTVRLDYVAIGKWK